MLFEFDGEGSIGALLGFFRFGLSVVVAFFFFGLFLLDLFLSFSFHACLPMQLAHRGLIGWIVRFLPTLILILAGENPL
jgi:hypothetical protein